MLPITTYTFTDQLKKPHKSWQRCQKDGVPLPSSLTHNTFATQREGVESVGPAPRAWSILFSSVNLPDPLGNHDKFQRGVVQTPGNAIVFLKKCLAMTLRPKTWSQNSKCLHSYTELRRRADICVDKSDPYCTEYQHAQGDELASLKLSGSRARKRRLKHNMARSPMYPSTAEEPTVESRAHSKMILTKMTQTKTDIQRHRGLQYLRDQRRGSIK